MDSSSFRMISAAVATVLLAALIAVIVLAVRDNPTAALPRLAGTPEAAAAMPLTGASPTPAAEQGEPVRVEAGGFAFRIPAGYTSDLNETTVRLTAEGGPAIGAQFWLEGGARSGFAAGAGETSEAVFARIATTFAGETGLAVGSYGPIQVAGADGLAAPLVGEDLAGEFVLVQPGPNQFFTLAGLAPVAVWERQAAADFAALRGSISFFAPPSGQMVRATATPMQAPTPSQSPSSEVAAEPSPTTPPAGAIAAAATATAPASAVTPAAAPEGATVQVPDAVTPTPRSAADAPSRGNTPAVRIYSNGNFVNSVAVMRSTIWAATGGGVIAWNKSSGSYVKFTTLDGLTTNRTLASAACTLPGLGVIFGSDQGIQLFDTQNGSWRTLDSANSDLRADDVAALWCDVARGFLVVAYGRNGLDLFDAETGTWRDLGEDAATELAGIRDLAVVGDGSVIWLATDAGLVELRDGEARVFTTENSPLATNRIDTVAVDGSGAVWLATGNTLYRTDGDEWDAYSAETAGRVDFPAGRITGLDVGDDGTIWIGSDQAQLCRFDAGIEGCVAFYSGEEGMATAPLTGLVIGADSEVYYTTAGGGISMFDGEQWRLFYIPDEIVPGNVIHDLAEDETGAIWVAATGGAARVPAGDVGSAQLFSPANSALPSVEVRAVMPDGRGGVWLGAGGVSFYDGETWANFTPDDGLAGDVVQAIAADDQGRTWIGTQTGLSIWTGSVFFNLTSANGLPSDDITALLADGDVIWIGTRGGGLLRFQDNQLQVFNRDNITLPDNTITALALDLDGSLLIGTEQGLARFAGSAMTPVTDTGTAAITALTVGGGAVWVANAEGALYRFDGQAWSPFDTAHLPGPEITALLIDAAGDLWAGTNQGGLARYTP